MPAMPRPVRKSEGRPLTVDDYEKAARKRLSKPAYDYYRSGADAERTLRDNRRAFSRWLVWYRVLVDVAGRHLSTTVLGRRVAMPILIAPTAYHRLAHDGGECATARAAAAAGTVLVVSTLATTSLEEVAAASDGPKWFQLYVHKDRGHTEELVRRAAASGYEALVLTVDTPVLGRRLRDERNAFALPKGLEMKNLSALPADVEGSKLSRFVADRHDASLSWRDLAWLQSLSSMPLVLKGVVRPDDAERAVGEGVRAIIVSNHGARQLDTAPATLDALAPIAERVGHRTELLLDGGVRFGTDVLKAIALGARAVLLGRPVLWGLAVAGQAGVEDVLRLLADELDRAMALAGCRDIAAIDRDLVAPRPR